MKAGKLFEAALMRAEVDLKGGTEINVRVRGNGKHLRLVVTPLSPIDFETTILERSKNASRFKAYKPELSMGETIRALRRAHAFPPDNTSPAPARSTCSLDVSNKDFLPDSDCGIEARSSGRVRDRDSGPASLPASLQ